MKLLIITQKVDINDDVLGFMHGWIAEFAKHCEKLTVICLQKWEYDLPNNVNVLSLGKEKYLLLEVRLQGGAKRRKKPNLKEQILFRIKYIFNFYKYIWRERGNYDKIFVHMNPEYVVLGGVFWKLWHKKIGMWYTHKAVNLKLRIAEKLANIIFTASKESFRLESKKLKVMGHGIDVKRIKNYELRIKNDRGFKIITVGRISRIKDYKILINSIEILVQNNINLQVDIIGAPVTLEDEKYLEKLKRIIKEKNLEKVINFVGSVPNKNIVQYYNDADLSINMSMTGGMDKVVLESMACGVPAIAFNKTFVEVFKKYADYLILNDKSEIELAEKIKRIIELPNEEKELMQKELQDIVVDEHSLESLIKIIVKEY